MNQAQCVMIIFFENDVIVFAEKFRNKKEKIKSAKLSNIETSLNFKKKKLKTRSYRTLRHH